MAGVDDIIGGWIREAEKTGEIKNLPGYGERLDLDDDKHVPAKYRMAYRVLKNAGITPPEIGLIQEVAALKEQLDREDDDKRRIAIQIEVNEAQQKLDMALEKFRNRI